MLRRVHMKKVEYLKMRLTEEGIPQMKSKSHIIPIPIGNPWLCTWISNELLNRYGHYVQSINYPTVSKGQERLRIAPSPMHSFEMIDEFIDNFVVVWRRSGLPFYQKEIYASSVCGHCQQPWNVDIDAFPCGLKTDCPLQIPC